MLNKYEYRNYNEWITHTLNLSKKYNTFSVTKRRKRHTLMALSYNKWLHTMMIASDNITYKTETSKYTPVESCSCEILWKKGKPSFISTLPHPFELKQSITNTYV